MFWDVSHPVYDAAREGRVPGSRSVQCHQDLPSTEPPLNSASSFVAWSAVNGASTNTNSTLLFNALRNDPIFDRNICFVVVVVVVVRGGEMKMCVCL